MATDAPTPLRGIGSMATRALLAGLASAHAEATGQPVACEAAGGVDVARRVAAGEDFDWVALAADALAPLVARGLLDGARRVDIARSEVAAAVPAGAPRPAIGDEATLRAAVQAAPAVACSTGPSGTALLALFERWGLADALRARLVMAPPGVPVARLLVEGRATLGFQQRSELLHAPGITLLDPLPPALAIRTVFSAAPRPGGARAAAVDAWLRFLASPEAAAAKCAQGMAPA